MTKFEFLKELEKSLCDLSEDERNAQLEYYSELIDDMTEDGVSEEEAVSKMENNGKSNRAPASPIPQKNGEGKIEINPEGLVGINIKWVCGEVRIVPCGENQISFSEELNSNRDEPLNFSIERGILFLRYGVRKNIWHGEGKNLTVFVPCSVKLQSFAFDGAAADLSAEAMTVNRFRAVSASGDISAGVSAEGVYLQTISGDVSLAGAVSSATVQTTSGDVCVSGVSEKLSLQTVSGDLSFSGSCRSVGAESVSGDILLNVKEYAGFTLFYRTVSGEFQSQLPLMYNRKEFSYGDGNNQISLHTVSGDIFINKE